jgi:hypothetical protein
MVDDSCSDRAQNPSIGCCMLASRNRCQSVRVESCPTVYTQQQAVEVDQGFRRERYCLASLGLSLISGEDEG